MMSYSAAASSQTMFSVAVAILMSEIGLINPASAALDKIYIRDGHFVDPFGRVRIFHGWNSVMKNPPWYDLQALNETRIAKLSECGFTAVRLGTMWSGAEPTEGKYNKTYIDTLHKIVTLLEKYKIYAILDMHQDILAAAFDTYDGVPRWLLDKLPPSPHPYPWPLSKASTQFGDGYLAEAVGWAFQRIYENYTGSVDSWSRFWGEMTKSLKSDSVLGYELINEPWCGDVYHHPTLFLPGVAGKKNLAPVYEKLSASIRAVDPNAVIFYEPVTWAVFSGLGGDMGTGFTHVPGGDDYRNRSVLSYHYYCWIMDPSQSDKPYKLWQRVICDDIIGPRAMPDVLSEIGGQLGGGSFLTEFGNCIPDDNPKSVNNVECEFVMNMADKYLQSWTYWESVFFNDTTGELILDTVRAFSRVYAHAVAGIPHTMSFDQKTAKFSLSFGLDTSIAAPTEIFVPAVQYPKGYTVEVSKGLMWHAAGPVVYVTKNATDFATNALLQDVFVNIQPAA